MGSEVREWYPDYPALWLSDERVTCMQLDEEGAYHRLLQYQWREGSIPAEPRLQAALCKHCQPETWERIWRALAPCFDEIPGQPGRLRNPHMAHIRSEQEEQHRARKKQATAAAKTRWRGRPAPPAALPLPDPEPRPVPEPCRQDATSMPAALPELCDPHAESTAPAVLEECHLEVDVDVNIIPPLPPPKGEGGEGKIPAKKEPAGSDRLGVLAELGFRNGEVRTVLAATDEDLKAWKAFRKALEARGGHQSPLGYLKHLMVRYRRPEDVGLPWWKGAGPEPPEAVELRDALQPLEDLVGCEFQGAHQRWRIELQGLLGVDQKKLITWQDLGPDATRKALGSARSFEEKLSGIPLERSR